MPSDAVRSRTQARLERLFVHIGRPPIPKPDTPTLFERELAQQESPLRGLSGDQFGQSHKITTAKPALTEEQSKRVLGNAAEHSPKVSTPGSGHGKQNCNSLGTSNTACATVPSAQQLIFFPRGKVSSSPRHADRHAEALNLEVPPGDLKTGESPVSAFCSHALLAKFPYKYMNDPESIVSKKFFAANKFYERKWSLFYLALPKSIGGKPLVLVPHKEAELFISEIAEAFNVNLFVPPFPFTINFYKDGNPQPAFLGRSYNRNDSDLLLQNIPYEVSDIGNTTVDHSKETMDSFSAFQERIAQAQAAAGARGRRRGANPSLLDSRPDQLIRSCNYLRLHPIPPQLASTTGGPISARHISQLRGTDPPADSSDPAHDSIEDRLVIVCIDVEADERDHSVITEIGVSTLDTFDLKDIRPGMDGASWTDCIRSRHFRIIGTEHIRNSRWCPGNPESFEFGTTEWVSLAEAPDVIDKCFQIPITNPNEAGNNLPSQNESDPLPGNEQQQPQYRNIVVLGHNIQEDLNYLANLGCKTTRPFMVPEPSINTSREQASDTPYQNKIVDVLDTILIDYAFHQVTPQIQESPNFQPRTLVALCLEFDIEAWNPHNAGNDARYTLEAFVKLVVRRQVHEGQQLALSG